MTETQTTWLAMAYAGFAGLALAFALLMLVVYVAIRIDDRIQERHLDEDELA